MCAKRKLDLKQDCIVPMQFGAWLRAGMRRNEGMGNNGVGEGMGTPGQREGTIVGAETSRSREELGRDGEEWRNKDTAGRVATIEGTIQVREIRKGRPEGEDNEL